MSSRCLRSLSVRLWIGAVLVGIATAPAKAQPPSTSDFLIDGSGYKAQLHHDADRSELVLDNGLVRRVWRIAPNAACVRFENRMNGEAMLRAVRPEARVTLDGKSYDVGGLVGQPNQAFLTPAWLEQLEADPEAFQFARFATGPIEPRLEWNRRRHAAPNAVWPPRGVLLQLDFEPPAQSAPDVRVSVHYAMYDGLPLISKWVTVTNRGDRSVTLDRYTGEELAVVEQASWVETRDGVELPRPDYLHVETDFSFGGMNPENANRHVVHWRRDPLYTSQVNYLRETPCLLVCEPMRGPAQAIPPGETWEGFRVFELAHDRGDRERRGLALRKMYRTVAPWVTENPLTHHLLSHDPDRVVAAIDEAAAVGFEAIILSFGSGFNMEDRDPGFLRRWREVADYAESRGIELGSYSLLSSRQVADDQMLVPPEGTSATHGRMPALTSEWGLNWLQTIRDFYASTGFDQFENDGPYPGDVDVTPRPPLQRGGDDSRWVQWRLATRLYRDLRGAGIFINAPDYYYLNGANKCSMGYREVNWSLPRAQQVIHTRQNIYDGTWTKTPSMGWMHVPLAEYHGGGPAATIEPLHENLDHYERMMLSNLGMGVQAHYRGPRLFDTPETQQRVKQVVDWYRHFRDILESDIVHGRRADGWDIDWVLHANPQLERPGMLCVWNPLDEAVTRTVSVNLYYTGLSGQVRIESGMGGRVTPDQPGARLTAGPDQRVELTVTIPPGGMRWVQFFEAGN